MDVLKISRSSAFEYEIEPICENKAFAPALVKRILNGTLGFYDKRIPLNKSSSGKYLLKISSLSEGLTFDNEYVFDLVLYDGKDDKINFVPVEESVSLAEMSGIVKNTEFDINFSLFKSGNGRMFLRLTLKNNLTFYAKNITEYEDRFEAELAVCCSGKRNVFIKRRSSSRHDGKYNASIRLNEKSLSDGASLVIVPKNITASYTQAAAEIWDVVIEYCGMSFDLVTEECYSGEYFDITPSFSGKLFSSENKYLSLWTREGANADRKKIKLAIIGSCFSKEAFHSVDYCNPDYKRFYDNGFVCWHESFVAMMSAPVSYDPSKIDNSDVSMQKAALRYGPSVFGKTSISELKAYKPDYLLIDTYVEVAASLFLSKDGGLITDAYYLLNTSALRDLDKVKTYHPTSEIRFELFKDAYKRFLAEISDVIPTERIVLVRTHPATKKLVSGKLVDWEDKTATEYQTVLWDRNDDYIVSQTPGIRVIDMRFGNYYSTEAPHLTFSRNHLNSEYYKDIMNRLNKIVLEDKMKKGE